MCVCIAKPKHIYIRSNEIKAFMSWIDECENEKEDDDETLHGYALQYIVIATHCLQFKTTLYIQSEAIASIAMHYIWTQ